MVIFRSDLVHNLQSRLIFLIVFRHLGLNQFWLLELGVLQVCCEFLMGLYKVHINFPITFPVSSLIVVFGGIIMISNFIQYVILFVYVNGEWIRWGFHIWGNKENLIWHSSSCKNNLWVKWYELSYCFIFHNGVSFFYVFYSTLEAHGIPNHALFTPLITDQCMGGRRLVCF